MYFTYWNVSRCFKVYDWQHSLDVLCEENILVHFYLIQSNFLSEHLLDLMDQFAF